MFDIHVSYNGTYPNLCSGTLVVEIEDRVWRFPSYCLSSGGSVWFSSGWEEHVEYGPWTITEFPEDFPDCPYLRDAVQRAVNDSIQWGCCGGCI